jgi:hypothetical protein
MFDSPFLNSSATDRILYLILYIYLVQQPVRTNNVVVLWRWKIVWSLACLMTFLLFESDLALVIKSMYIYFAVSVLRISVPNHLCINTVSCFPSARTESWEARENPCQGKDEKRPKFNSTTSACLPRGGYATWSSPICFPAESRLHLDGCAASPWPVPPALWGLLLYSLLMVAIVCKTAQVRQLPRLSSYLLLV